jgi:restriction endonuclease S subunit
LIPSAEVDNRFLWYLTNREDWWLKSGTAQPFVKVKDSLLRPFQLPPIAEQEKIVEILEEQLARLDAVVKSVQTVREKAAQFRRSLLKLAIEQAVFDGIETSRVNVTLDDLVDSPREIVDGPFGSNLKSEHYTDSGARVIRLQNIGFGEFRDDEAFISEEHYLRLEKHNVVEGDLLFASLGENLPRACLMPDVGVKAIVKADCIRVRLSSKVHNHYVLHATQTPGARQWAVAQLHGLGRPRLGLGNIRKFPISLPTLAEQKRISSIIESHLDGLQKGLDSADEIERKATVLRRSLLHAAFSGELTRSWREANV